MKTQWLKPFFENQNALKTHSPCPGPIRFNGFHFSAREFIHRAAVRVYELFGTELDGILEELSQALVG